MKNRNEISNDLRELILKSENRFIKEIFKNDSLQNNQNLEGKTPRTAKKYLAEEFRADMEELLKYMNSCDLNFIRFLNSLKIF